MIATTRADLYRDTDGEPNVDEYGDETDDNTDTAAVATDFPASIIERRKDYFDQASNEFRQITYYSIRVPSSLTPKAGDRVKDRRTGDFYIVDSVKGVERGLSGRASVSMNARRAAP